MNRTDNKNKLNAKYGIHSGPCHPMYGVNTVEPVYFGVFLTTVIRKPVVYSDTDAIYVEEGFYD